MLVYLGTLLVGVQIAAFIYALIKKQKKASQVSLGLAGLAIIANAGLAIYYNGSPRVAGGLGLDGLGKFVLSLGQLVLAGGIFLLMVICYRIKGQSKRK